MFIIILFLLQYIIYVYSLSMIYDKLPYTLYTIEQNFNSLKVARVYGRSMYELCIINIKLFKLVRW